MLRKKGVVGKFVEFYGDGLNHLTLADRATIANMAPEYGATCGFFPVDDEALELSQDVERAPRRASRWSRNIPSSKACSARRARPIRCSPTRSALDLADVVPSMAGPKRPEGRVALNDIAAGFAGGDGNRVQEGR